MAYESLKIKLIYNSFAAPKKDKTLVRLICMEYVILKSSILQVLFQAFKKIVKSQLYYSKSAWFPCQDSRQNLYINL